MKREQAQKLERARARRIVRRVVRFVRRASAPIVFEAGERVSCASSRVHYISALLQLVVLPFVARAFHFRLLRVLGALVLPQPLLLVSRQRLNARCGEREKRDHRLYVNFV